ncbi:MAG: hypothetical protein R2697_12590 [Ilumatobacteraceae bacterium]
MTDRAQRPFWIHQFVEYVIGLALIVFGFQDTHPTVPAVVGIVVMLNAAVVRGPFGAFRLIGRKLHRWVDLVVMAFLVFAAVQPWVEMSSLGRLALIGIVIPLAFSWWYTDWTDRAERKQRRADQAGQRTEDIGATAGRKAAQYYKAGKKMIERDG